MMSEITNKSCYTTLIAVFAAGLLSGGISWQYLIISAVFLIISIALNIKNIKFNSNSILIIIIFLSGMFSLAFTSADKQNAIHEFMKIIIFALAFYTGTVTDKKTIPNLIIPLGVAVAVFGILGYCNILRINEFVFNDRTLCRLQSFIKYANITAVVLGCSYFALINVYKENPKPYIPYVSACVLTALYLTISKAAIPLFFLAGVLEITFERKYAKYFLLQNFICLIFAIVIILSAKKHYYSISFLTIATCIAIVGKIGKNSLNSEMNLRKIRLVISLILTVGAVCVLIYAKNTDIFTTLISRFVYSRDALKLLKSNWLSGIGAGGWKYYRYGVQSIGYNVNYVHNSLIQLWLDCGLIGFIGFAAIFVNSTVCAFRKKEYTLLCILLFITLHSVLDIDFSFGIVLIIYGLITGYLSKDGRQISCFKPFMVISLVLSLLFVCYSCGEYIIRSRFESAYLKEDYRSALRYAHKLEKLCPADSNLKVSIAALDNNVSEEYLEKAVLLSPLDKDIYLKYINYIIDNKLPIDIYELSKHFINLAPKQESTYVQEQDFTKKALENGLCSFQEYERTVNLAKQMMKKENVIDRNELLNEITE